MDRLKQAHEHCTSNKSEIEKSEKCGCFYCLEIFNKDRIQHWIDENCTTALCPFCGIDAVIGDKSGFPITKEFLTEMKERWF